MIRDFWRSLANLSSLISHLGSLSRELAMAMSGEAQARERRMATEAGVCPRLTAPIPLSAAKTAGRGGNVVEAQDEWSHRECQAGCRRCGAISD